MYTHTHMGGVRRPSRASRALATSVLLIFRLDMSFQFCSACSTNRQRHRSDWHVERITNHLAVLSLTSSDQKASDRSRSSSKTGALVWHCLVLSVASVLSCLLLPAVCCSPILCCQLLPHTTPYQASVSCMSLKHRL